MRRSVSALLALLCAVAVGPVYANGNGVWVHVEDEFYDSHEVWDGGLYTLDFEGHRAFYACDGGGSGELHAGAPLEYCLDGAEVRLVWKRTMHYKPSNMRSTPPSQVTWPEEFVRVGDADAGHCGVRQAVVWDVEGGIYVGDPYASAEQRDVCEYCGLMEGPCKLEQRRLRGGADRNL